MNPVSFLKSTIEEARKVEWLTAKELFRYTLAVVIFIVISTLFIAFWDVFFITTRGIAVNCLNDDNFIECAKEQVIEEEPSTEIIPTPTEAPEETATPSEEPTTVPTEVVNN